MRRGLSVLAMAVSFCVAGGIAAEIVVLKGGDRIELAKPYVTKGRMAILTLKDGSLRSVPHEDIDLAKTAAEKSHPAAAVALPDPSATPRPLTIAEAANARGVKKAAIVLTDQDVARGQTMEDVANQKTQAAGEVDISGVSSNRTKTGYTIRGTVVNRGKVQATGVSVTIEMIGKEDKPVMTAFGQVAKPALEPGESSAFQSEITTEEEAKTFRYVPAWSVQTAVSDGGQSSGSGQRPQGQSSASGGTGKGKAEPEPAATPPPTPTPRPRETPTPRPDVAPPSASVPMEGNSTGGVFIPRGEVVGQPTRPPQ